MNERGVGIGGFSLKGTVAGAPGRFGAYNHASWLVPSAQWSSRLSNASLPCALVLLSSPCFSRFLRTRNLIIFLARDRLPGGLLKTFLRVTIFFPRLYFEICSRNNVIFFFFFFFDRRSVNYYYYLVEISQSRIKHLNNFEERRNWINSWPFFRARVFNIPYILGIQLKLFLPVRNIGATGILIT